MKFLDIILQELFNIYSLDDMKSNGVRYEIIEDTSYRLTVHIKNKEDYYIFKMYYDSKIPEVSFGISDETFKKLDMKSDTNKPFILPTIFGFVKYFLDKHNVLSFKCTVWNENRLELYKRYIINNFKNWDISFEGDEFPKKLIVRKSDNA